MAFNRNGGNRGGGGGFRPRFGDRDDRGPVEMHDAICDNCGKSCQVPFRPTSGKPIFCSACFENKQSFSSNKRESSDSRRSEDRPMFNAVCADCGDKCSVPFQPSGDKPVFCSNCFGEKKNGGSRDQFETLNAKLDTILKLLENKNPAKKAKVKETKEVSEAPADAVEETAPVTEE